MSQGSRIRTLADRSSLKSLSFIRVLIFTLHFFAIAFVASAAILESGLDLSTISSCRAAIYVCLVFYVGSKILVQMFLVERLHVIQHRLRRRRKDWVWIASIAIIVSGFGTIAIVAFLYPIAEITGVDSKCRIGVPVKVTIPLITYDIVVNVGLTAIFVLLLRPLLDFRRNTFAAVDHRPSEQDISGTPKSSAPRSSTLSDVDAPVGLRTELATVPVPTSIRSGNHASLRALKTLIYKSIGGAVAMLIPTVINLGLLFRWRGEEQGWLCFTLCTVDVTWSVAVVHLLTVDRREV